MTFLSIVDGPAAGQLPEQTTGVVPSMSAQEEFAALLNDQSVAGAPAALLAVQEEHVQKAVGIELVAKVAGSLTQSINKVVNMP